ncbi:cation-translocating P-type ATPase [Kaistella jeonii]|uniref:Haloacid dehalogenase n=1 Tax=Kaistella jeonii TaxID=266749 RepID=A0A0C1FA69_9FLAO|nr:cation-translocating P-type ATPase [Kaistella jeonii]KIA88803.1 haloacid dehalogenase [Kaistella jeonii]SFC14365.1 Ca2+-transporting ATPase [Kaistella jeonii]VEI97437.1 Calcium-transporting ATPase lmo0841 [Kaistella jeonii]
MDFNIPEHLKGLTDAEVKRSQEKFGYNQLKVSEKSSWLKLLFDIFREPMLILLIIIAVIYLVVGNYGEALFMLLAIVLVSGISFYQDNRSKKALEALEKLNEPLSKVIRNNKILEIPTHEIAVGDLCFTEEGKMINADGVIVHSNDFSVNESSLTGESFSVFKDNKSEDKEIYSGTSTVSGLAVFEVQKIGKETKLGKIGESILNIKEEKSPLQIQIERFIKYMAIIGIAVFLSVCTVNYYHTRNIVDSLLNGLTLAMSILPEEIPVAFTTFMALGAWKLMREGIIIKKSSIVETLGSTTVICTDKTGTITENSMHLKAVYDFKSERVFNDKEFNDQSVAEVIQYAMWSSEPVPFDPMEKTLHQIYAETQKEDLRSHYKMFHEYPLEGKPPMMTHLFKNNEGERIVAAKGAPEAIINVCNLSEVQKSAIRKEMEIFGKEGYRLLGVAKSDFKGDDFPLRQQEISFEFLGLVVFYDPPKKDIQNVFRKIELAGIKIKVITGDNAQTTESIAIQAGIPNVSNPVNGDEIANLPEAELMKIANEKVLFTRMFPEAKLRVVEALKQNGEIVAMIGDGVNDGPALKAAHIGVAMGEKGTEIAKAAASVVLTNDDLGKLVIAIAAGRRIYTNIKKAVQYIISIHIPIILTVSLPLFLGWAFPQIFTPVHVIFLELVMGPTCSIVYENEPMEKNTMLQKPRPITETFLTWRELILSIIQGLMITAGVLFIYQLTYRSGGNEELTRTMVFTTLIFANILLSLANRSFYYSMFESFRNKNILLVIITFLTILILGVMLYVAPVSNFFKLTSLNIEQILTAASAAILSVMWFEIYKLIKRFR